MNHPIKNPRRRSQRPQPLVLAMPRHDQGWWSTVERTPITCPHCGESVPDEITVMAYCASLDHLGEQTERHPGWKEKGWLTLHECRRCDDQWYGDTLNDAEVRAWGEKLGGWRTEPLLGNF